MIEDREEYRRQAAVLDLITKWLKYPPPGEPDWFVGRFLGNLGRLDVPKEIRYDPYRAFCLAADETFGTHVPPEWLRSYVTTLKRKTPNAAIGGFLRRTHEEPALRKAFLSAARDHDSLQRVAAANGLVVTAEELKTYLDPWQIFATLLERLLKIGTITPAEFEDKASFALQEVEHPDFGSDLYRALLMAALSASGWAFRLRNLSSLSVPIACVVFPTTAVIIGGYEGETFDFKELGNMFKATFENALSGIADALENFHGSVGSLFG